MGYQGLQIKSNEGTTVEIEHECVRQAFSLDAEFGFLILGAAMPFN